MLSRDLPDTLPVDRMRRGLRQFYDVAPCNDFFTTFRPFFAPSGDKISSSERSAQVMYEIFIPFPVSQMCA